MITHLFEAGRPKCDPYWPAAAAASQGEDSTPTEHYGEVSVTLVREDVLAAYTLRTFTVRVEKEERAVYQVRRLVFENIPIIGAR